MEWKFWKKKEKTFLVLDVGTEAVKSIIAEKNGDKIKILASATNYFKSCDSNFLSEEFEIGLFKKTVVENLEELCRRFTLFLGRKAAQFQSFPIFLLLPPDIVKAKVVEIEYQRKSSQKISQEEKEKICNHILEEAKQKVSESAFDVEHVRLGVIENRIEGYSIKDIIDCKGIKLDFKILTVFAPKIYLEKIKKIFLDLKLNIFQIIHLSETIPSFLENNEISSGIFVDVGAKVTQAFFLKNEKMESINCFEMGGCNFSDKLSENFGLDKDSARSLKEDYAENSLSPESSERIKKLFSSEKNIWKNNFAYFKKSEFQNFPVYLFGGGSALSETREVFLKEKVILPKNIKRIIIPNRESRNSQMVPCLLVSLYATKNI